MSGGAPSIREQLVAACDSHDALTWRRLGWEPVARALKDWWPPPLNPPVDWGLLRGYADALGAHPPEDVIEALRARAHRFRPGPADVLAHLNAAGDDSGSRVDVGRGRSREMELDTLGDVAQRRNAGQSGCGCPFHRSQWDREPGTWVRRCPVCGGLEPGQLHAAEDAGLIRAAA